MTHAEAIRKTAIQAQRMGARYRADAERKRNEIGCENVLADMYANWSSEQYAIARALMRIDCEEMA